MNCETIDSSTKKTKQDIIGFGNEFSCSNKVSLLTGQPALTTDRAAQRQIARADRRVAARRQLLRTAQNVTGMARLDVNVPLFQHLRTVAKCNNWNAKIEHISLKLGQTGC